MTVKLLSSQLYKIKWSETTPFWLHIFFVANLQLLSNSVKGAQASCWRVFQMSTFSSTQKIISVSCVHLPSRMFFFPVMCILYPHKTIFIPSFLSQSSFHLSGSLPHWQSAAAQGKALRVFLSHHLMQAWKSGQQDLLSCLNKRRRALKGSGFLDCGERNYLAGHKSFVIDQLLLVLVNAYCDKPCPAGP